MSSQKEILFKGIIFDIIGIDGPNNREYQAVKHPGAVAVLPIRRVGDESITPLINQVNVDLPENREKLIAKAAEDDGGCCSAGPVDCSDPLSGIEVLLVMQFRPAVGASLWEAPAGTLDIPDERPSECARRELLEETGYDAASIINLGTTYTSPGYSTEKIHLYLAQGLSLTGEPEEGIKSSWVRLSEAVEWIRVGTLMDAKTVVLVNLLCHPKVLRLV